MSAILATLPPTRTQRLDLRDEWAAINGLRPSTADAHCSIAPLVDPYWNRCGEQERERRRSACHRDYMDHGTTWVDEAGQVVLVGQPYHVDAEQLAADCDAYGLVADVLAAPSWHYPGGVLTVILRKG